MKALFLVDSVLGVSTFAPVIRKLPCGWESVFVNYYIMTKDGKAKIDACAEALSARHIDLMVHSRHQVKSLIRQESPDILVFAKEETNMAESLFVEEADRRGIPTLLVHHSTSLNDESSRWGSDSRWARVKHLNLLLVQACKKLMRRDASLWNLLQTGMYRIGNDYDRSGVLSRYDRYSMVAGYSELMRETLVNSGVKPENIRVVGNPRYDVYYQNKRRPPSIGGGNVLLITTYLVEFGLWSSRQREQLILDICSVVDILGLPSLKIKVHPVSERIGDYKRIVKEHGLNALVYQDEELSNLIKECDIAIATTSSAGLEVLIARKPLIIYNPYKDSLAYGEDSGVYIARNRDELEVMVKNIMECGMSEKRMRLVEGFVSRYTYGKDGKASERIADLIVAMAKEKACQQMC